MGFLGSTIRDVYVTFHEAGIPDKAPACIDNADLYRNIFQITPGDHSAKVIPFEVPALPEGDGILRVGVGLGDGESGHSGIAFTLQDANGGTVASAYSSREWPVWILHDVKEKTAWRVSIEDKEDRPRGDSPDHEVHVFVYVTPKSQSAGATEPSDLLERGLSMPLR
jgi:hypothetical protein